MKLMYLKDTKDVLERSCMFNACYHSNKLTVLQKVYEPPYKNLQSVY